MPTICVRFESFPAAFRINGVRLRGQSKATKASCGPRLTLPASGREQDMERGSNKHGPRLDHELKRETRSYEQGAPAGGRVEEHREPEGASDDEELADRMIVKRRSNDDLTPEELELRSEIAKHLKMSIFPASRTAIIRAAENDFV